MTTQPELDLSSGIVRNDHPATSHEAAAAIDATTGRALVLSLLRRHDGLTDDQMQDVLGMNPSTQRPRRVELVNAGLVEATDERRQTRSGRKAIVWRAKS